MYRDVVSLLKQTVWQALDRNEFVIFEQGGWDAPTEPSLC